MVAPVTPPKSAGKGITSSIKSLPPGARYGLLGVAGVGGFLFWRRWQAGKAANNAAANTNATPALQTPFTGNQGGFGGGFGGGGMGSIGAALPPQAPSAESAVTSSGIFTQPSLVLNPGQPVGAVPTMNPDTGAWSVLNGSPTTAINDAINWGVLNQLVPNMSITDPSTGRLEYSGPQGQPGYGGPQPGSAQWTMPDGRTAWYFPNAAPSQGNIAGLANWAKSGKVAR